MKTEFQIPDAPEFTCELCNEKLNPKLREPVPTQKSVDLYPGILKMPYAFWEPIVHPDCVVVLEIKRKDKEFQEYVERERQERLAAFKKLGFPVEHFDKKSWDTFEIHDGNKQAFSAIMNWSDQPFGIFLSGPPGSGKTHLLTSFVIGQICKENRKRMVFQRTSSFFDQLRHGYSDGTFEQLFKATQKAELLFLDDIGTEKVSDWIDEKLTQILDYRMENKLPTFITSNLSGKDLAEKFSQRVVSRIMGCCIPYYIQGKDKRIEQMRERKKEYEEQWQNK